MELNINQNVSDAFYRYKMPSLLAKVEGKGNGIKTVIVNVTEIAKALNRKPIYVTKYFGCELGAQIHVDEKNDRYIVNGSHNNARLQELLFNFIKKFVLCQECSNPETTLKVKSRTNVVTTTCAACGHSGIVDPAHRLTQFIIKNPPDDDATTTGKKNKKSKGTKGNEQSSKADEQAPAGDSQTTTDDEDDEDNVDWGEDTTEEAQKKRYAELSAMAKHLTVNTDAEKSDGERADIFFKFCMNIKKKDDLAKRIKDVRDEAMRLHLSGRAALIVGEVVLSDPNTVLEDIKKYKMLLIQFTRCPPDPSKAQGYVLGVTASLIEKNEAKLLTKTAKIMHALYSEDIVEEETILSWFGKSSMKRYVSEQMVSKIKSACQPFLTWLETAEVESDEEGDGEKDAEENAAEKTNGEVSAAPSQKPQEEESEDEIDIDAI